MRVISREERHIKRIIWHQSVVVCVWSGRTGDAIGCRCESRSAFPVEASALAIAHPTNHFIYLALLDRRLHPKHILANKIREKKSKKKPSEHKTRSASCDGEKKRKQIFTSFRRSLGGREFFSTEIIANADRRLGGLVCRYISPRPGSTWRLKMNYDCDLVFCSLQSQFA